MIDDIIEEVGEDNVYGQCSELQSGWRFVGAKVEAVKLDTLCCSLYRLSVRGFREENPTAQGDNCSSKKITTYIYARMCLTSLLHKFTNESDLIRPGLTRFATSYLTSGCLYDNMASLIHMFELYNGNLVTLQRVTMGSLLKVWLRIRSFGKMLCIA
jgi:hypothetical protein